MRVLSTCQWSRKYSERYSNPAHFPLLSGHGHFTAVSTSHRGCKCPTTNPCCISVISTLHVPGARMEDSRRRSTFSWIRTAPRATRPSVYKHPCCTGRRRRRCGTATFPVRQQPARRTRRPFRLIHSPRAIVQGARRHKPLASSICSAAFSRTQHNILSDGASYAGIFDRLYIFGGNDKATMARTSWVTCQCEDTFRQAFRGRRFRWATLWYSTTW